MARSAPGIVRPQELGPHRRREGHLDPAARFAWGYLSCGSMALAVSASRKPPQGAIGQTVQLAGVLLREVAEDLIAFGEALSPALTASALRCLSAFLTPGEASFGQASE